MMDALAPFLIRADEANATLAAILRARLAGLSWRQVRDLVAARRVKVLGEVCLDPARRLKEGDEVEVLARPARVEREKTTITIQYIDEHVVVVEKPSGLSTVRHPAERDWADPRKALSPTLEDVVPGQMAAREGRRCPRLRIVQRLDKETSGLVVFARSVAAERGLGQQFRVHTVTRRYLAIVPGRIRDQRIHSFLVRDRGDGRRGSTTLKDVGKEAITHIEAVERLKKYTVVGCRLETGRTHQIRIHLAELGHPVCGDRVYTHRVDGTRFVDDSGAPRLALHAAELGFEHPVTGKPMRWEMDLPADLQAMLERIRGRGRDADRDQMDG